MNKATDSAEARKGPSANPDLRRPLTPGEQETEDRCVRRRKRKINPDGASTRHFKNSGGRAEAKSPRAGRRGETHGIGARGGLMLSPTTTDAHRPRRERGIRVH